MDIKDELMIENIIDLYGLIEGFTDRQRVAVIKAACSTLDEEGSIERIRKAVNSSEYDD